MERIMFGRNVCITARGWPWQLIYPHWASNLPGEKYGWNPFTLKGMGRFGGGWAFKFGVNASSTLRDWCFDLGIGSIRLIVEKKPAAAQKGTQQ